MKVTARLIEVELRVHDIDRSLRFYRDLLGLPLGQPEVHQDGGARHVHAAWGSWAEGATDFLLFNIYPADTGKESRANVGFAVEDLDGVHATLQRAGVDVVQPPQARVWGRTAVYRDPDGNTISVTQLPGENRRSQGRRDEP
jgi:catechol 2,3-dioxygenase-like lactoylglutathione lyase family enzyme